MIREIKVCAKWQGNKQVPNINLQGIYLSEFGFNPGEQVRVEFFRDEIRIKRMNTKMILKALSEQNPSLAKLIAEFDCVSCD